MNNKIIEIKGNTFYITDEVTGEEWKIAAKNVGYSDNRANTITYYDLFKKKNPITIPFANVKDSGGNYFVNFQALTDWNDTNLGKSSAKEEGVKKLDNTDLDKIKKIGKYVFDFNLEISAYTVSGIPLSNFSDQVSTGYSYMEVLNYDNDGITMTIQSIYLASDGITILKLERIHNTDTDEWSSVIINNNASGKELETAIDFWVDGKIVYEKNIYVDNLGVNISGKSFNINHNLNINQYIKHDIILKGGLNIDAAIVLNGIDGFKTSVTNYDSNDILIEFSAISTSSTGFYLILKYTKNI